MATTNVCKLRPVKKLRIRLISGHHLPKIAGKIKGNVIQPYVKIKIRGHLVDESEYVTEVVPKVNDFLFKKYIPNHLAVHMIQQSIPLIESGA